ncbi:MAG: tripartite tricarboxylate transporter substrate binding protein [Burkholderiales bacterium]
MQTLIRPLAIIALLAASMVASAQTWPTKNVRVLVGAPPGGGTDIIARVLADKFAAAFGQPVIVENRPGASNTIAADLTAKAPPDGHTLLVATTTGQAIAPHLMKLGYDPLKGLAPVALIATVPNVLVVNNDVPAKTVKELVALVKAAPDKYSYGSSGPGSTQHLAGEAFAHALGLKMVHVPYKGSSQALTDLLGGQIQMAFDTTSSAISHITSGKVRPLAVMSPKRSPQLPNVPTLAEAGFPGIEMTTWYGLFVTGGTPQPIVDRLYQETTKVLQMPDVRKRLADLAGEPGTLTQAEFAALNKADFDRFGKLIREAKVQLQQ